MEGNRTSTKKHKNELLAINSNNNNNSNDGSANSSSNYINNDFDAADVALAATVSSPQENNNGDDNGLDSSATNNISGDVNINNYNSALSNTITNAVADSNGEAKAKKYKRKAKSLGDESSNTTPPKKKTKKNQLSVTKDQNSSTSNDELGNMKNDNNLAGEDGTNKLNVSQNHDIESRNVIKVIGSCEHDQPYSHDFLHCEKCKVQTIQCSIKDCPCRNAGVLLLTTESESMKRTYRHQFIYDDKSVAIHLNKPKEAISRVSNRLKVVENRSIRKNKNSNTNFILVDGDAIQAANFSSQLNDASTTEGRTIPSESNIAEIMTQLNPAAKKYQESQQGKSIASTAAAAAVAAIAAATTLNSSSDLSSNNTSSQKGTINSYTPYYFIPPTSTTAETQTTGNRRSSRKTTNS